jgi:hypothetical protein
MGEGATAPFQGHLHGSLFPSSNRKALDAGSKLVIAIADINRRRLFAPNHHRQLPASPRGFCERWRAPRARRRVFLRVGRPDKRRQSHAEYSQDFRVFACANPYRLANGSASESRATPARQALAWSGASDAVPLASQLDSMNALMERYLRPIIEGGNPANPTLGGRRSSNVKTRARSAANADRLSVGAVGHAYRRFSVPRCGSAPARWAISRLPRRGRSGRASVSIRCARISLRARP